MQVKRRYNGIKVKWNNFASNVLHRDEMHNDEIRYTTGIDKQGARENFKLI